MEKSIIIIIIMSVFFYGCVSTGNEIEFNSFSEIENNEKEGVKIEEEDNYVSEEEAKLRSKYEFSMREKENESILEVKEEYEKYIHPEGMGGSAALKILIQLENTHSKYIPDVDKNGYITGKDLDFLEDSGIFMSPSSANFGKSDKEIKEKEFSRLIEYKNEDLEIRKEQDGYIKDIYKIGVNYEELWNNILKLRDDNLIDLNKDGVSNYEDVYILDMRFSCLLQYYYNRNEEGCKREQNLIYDINNDGFLTFNDVFLLKVFAGYNIEERRKRKIENNINGEKRRGENIIEYVEKLLEGGFLDINQNGFFTTEDAINLNQYIDGLEPGDESVSISGDSTIFTEDMINFIEKQDINIPNNNWRKSKPIVSFSYDENKIKTYLKNGEDSKKINLFLIVEEESEEKAKEQLEKNLFNASFVFFKTKLIRDNINKFNIYYYHLPQADYSDRNTFSQPTNFGLNKKDERDKRFYTIMEEIKKTNKDKYFGIFLTKSPNIISTGGEYITISNRVKEYNDIGRILTHELGHTLFDLLDEYYGFFADIYGVTTTDVNSGNRKNCILKKDIQRWKDNIPNWDGELYEGCHYTRKGIYRGTPTSIMMGSQQAFPKEVHEKDFVKYWEEGDIWGPINSYYIEKVFKKYE